MHIQQLPTYSCERYYLLSEIEQRASFVFMDEPDNSEQVSTQNPRIDVVYLLWDYSHGVEWVKKRIETVLDRHPSCLSRCLIVLECLVASKDAFESSEIQAPMEALFEWAEEVCPSSFLFIGVSDKITGTPGLEKCYDFLKFIVTAAPAAEGNIRFIGATRADCLGYDPTREPDAGSDVYQVLCCRSINAYNLWERLFKEFIQKLYGIEDAEKGDNTSTTTTNFNSIITGRGTEDNAAAACTVSKKNGMLRDTVVLCFVVALLAILYKCTA